jgi:hypothetical protein
MMLSLGRSDEGLYKVEKAMIYERKIMKKEDSCEDGVV